MTDLRARLCNWGLHVGGHTGPETFSSVAPMFRDAPMSKWWEEAWGDQESAPEEITPPVDENDAELIDRLVLSIKSERLKMALLIEYANMPKSFSWRRYGYIESVNEACRLMEDLLTGKSKKEVAVRMIAEGRHSERFIADVAGCSQQYINQLRTS